MSINYEAASVLVGKKKKNQQNFLSSITSKIL